MPTLGSNFGILLLFAGSLTAVPVSYQINFEETTNSGILPTVSFEYDASQADPFSNFIGTWDGAKQIDFTVIANTSMTDINLSSPCLDGATGGQAVFAMLTQCPGAYWMGESYTDITFLMFAAADGDVGIGGLIDDVTGPNDETFSNPVFGTFQVVDSSNVPEPGTLALTCVGIALIAWSRCRS